MLIALAVILGLVEALFTALEVSLGAVSRARLRTMAGASAIAAATTRQEEAQNRLIAQQATRVLELLERPDRLTLLFIAVTSLCLWGAATALTADFLLDRGRWWLLILTFIGLLFVAEVVPLLVAAQHAESIALRGGRFVKSALRLSSPILALVGGVSFGLARVLGSGPNASPQVTAGELRSALAAAEEDGTLPAQERALIEGAMDLRETTVREVMTPRPNVVGVPVEATLGEALDIALDAGHSRLPIYDGSLDRVIGVLATKDLLPQLRANRSNERILRQIARVPYYVPEGKRVAAALDELRRGSTLLAVVVDDNGGTSGLVTLEDLLEEIVGEIQDEYDPEETSLRLTDDADERAVFCEGNTPVREFGRFFAREFKLRTTLVGRDDEPVESGRSLASLALELFENVPSEGDRARVGSATATTPDIEARVGLDLEVVRMDGPRIALVKIVPVAEKGAP